MKKPAKEIKAYTGSPKAKLWKAGEFYMTSSQHGIRRFISRAEVKDIFVKLDGGEATVTFRGTERLHGGRIYIGVHTARFTPDGLRLGCNAFSKTGTKALRRWAEATR